MFLSQYQTAILFKQLNYKMDILSMKELLGSLIGKPLPYVAFQVESFQINYYSKDISSQVILKEQFKVNYLVDIIAKMVSFKIIIVLVLEKIN